MDQKHTKYNYYVSPKYRVNCNLILGFNMFIEIQEICTIIQLLYTDTYYINKLHNDNNVNNYIHNCCQTPKITNDKVEAVQLIYLSIDTKSRQQ